MSDFDPATRLDKSYVSKIRGASDAAKKRRTAMARESEAQKIRNAYLAGVHDERMRWSPRCENCGVEGWERPLELHHLIKRSQGQGYRPGDPGVDRPSTLQLLCRHCHAIRESNPLWSRLENPDSDSSNAAPDLKGEACDDRR